MTAPQPQSERIREAALDYARRGWPVLPVHWPAPPTGCSCGHEDCDRAAKHPRTKHGLSDASVDPAQLVRWFRKTSNVAIRTGAGLMVLDVDPSRDGDVSLRELEEVHGELPDTLRALTGGGGEHVFLSVSGPVPSSVDKVAPGLDVRADGGYVVAVPSLHSSGNRYEWDVGAAEKLADAPEWLLKLCRKRRVRRSPEEGTPDAVIDGGRNEFLTSQAGAMRRRGMGERAMFAALVIENEDRCRPPLDEAEVRKITQSVVKYEPGDDVGGTWQKDLKRNREGAATKDPGNAALFLSYRPEWKGVLEFDEFADVIKWRRQPPEGIGRPDAGDELADHHITYAQHWLVKKTGPSFGRDSVAAAIDVAARRNTVHPLRDWLDGLGWDGEDRLDKWLSSYLGAVDDDYTRAIGRWFLVSAVARVFRPGCQADHVLVLEGPQGIGKSSAVRILAGAWYLGALPDLRSRDAAHALRGRWIIEVGELDAFRGAASSRVKDFVTQVIDIYRQAYGHYFVRRPRSCVFVGTTNEGRYLPDSSGNRRFWPVKVVELDRAGLVADRDQIWAEAKEVFVGGGQWHPEKALAQRLADEQAERQIVDPWEQRIAAWFKARPSVDFTTADYILTHVLGVELARLETRHAMRVGDVLHRLGWHNARRREGSLKVRGYERDTDTSDVKKGSQR